MPSSPFSPSSPLPSFPRKRRAASPSVLPSPSPEHKRRRPNLAHGFSSLSIDARPDRPKSPLPSYDDSQAAYNEVDDEDRARYDDVRVEELPDASQPSLDDADDVFSLPRPYAVAQPDQTEQPDACADFSPEAVTARGRKRHASPGPSTWKRRRYHMDVEIEQGRHGPQWDEPDKDRIVITSLSSPSSSRSSSAERSPLLSQPGARGFTLSPSLLTHLLAAQREQHVPAKREQGLVLYRRPPWADQASHGGAENRLAFAVDAGRFEEVGDEVGDALGDELGGELGGEIGGERMEIDEDMAMDVE